MSNFLAGLLLLLIGAGLTGLLLPYITRQWQIQQKAIEVKSELVRDMTRLCSEMAMESVGRGIATNLDQYEYDTENSGDRILDWLIRGDVIFEALGLYFTDISVSNDWIDLLGLYIEFAQFQNATSRETRIVLLQEMAKELGDDIKDVDLEILYEPISALDSIESLNQHNRASQQLHKEIISRRGYAISRVVDSKIRGEFDIKEFLGL